MGLDGDGRLQIFGYRADARAILGAMDVVTLSSVFEAGLPYVLMEAMALETPVIVTGSGGVPELVEQGRDGLLVPPENPRALADALEKVARDGGLAATLAQSARKRVTEGFGSQRSAKALLRLIEARPSSAIAA